MRAYAVCQNQDLGDWMDLQDWIPAFAGNDGEGRGNDQSISYPKFV